MIIEGLLGSGIFAVVTSGDVALQLKPNTEIMVQFILPISVFAAVLVTGVIAWGIVFITNYFEMKNSVERIDTMGREY